MSESLQTYESPQDVYARHLVSHRGYPLWTPEPESHLPDDYQNDGLRIGDVGLVVPEEGGFDVLFNICLPTDHPLHEGYGVPDNFEPIALCERDIFKTQDADDPGCVISSTSVIQMEVDPIEGRSDYRFHLSSSEGALLILPQGASRHTLRNHRRFGEYASKHAPEWYKFARDTAGRSVANDSLYLITGFYKTRSWSLASFQGAAGTGDSAQFKVTHVDGGSVTGAYSWNTTRALDKRVGPRRYTGKENQSIFIKGFKIAIKDEPLGKKRVEVTAKVPCVQAQHEEFTNVIETPEEDEAAASNRVSQAGSAARQHGTLGSVSIQHVPDVSKPFHPSDHINRYLLTKERFATVAITHDSQWTALLERGLLETGASVEAKHLHKILSENYDVILQNGVVSLQEKYGMENKVPTNLKHGITTRALFACLEEGLDSPTASEECAISRSSSRNSYVQPLAHDWLDILESSSLDSTVLTASLGEDPPPHQQQNSSGASPTHFSFSFSNAPVPIFDLSLNYLSPREPVADDICQGKPDGGGRAGHTQPTRSEYTTSSLFDPLHCQHDLIDHRAVYSLNAPNVPSSSHDDHSDKVSSRSRSAEDGHQSILSSSRPRPYPSPFTRPHVDCRDSPSVSLIQAASSERTAIANHRCNFLCPVQGCGRAFSRAYNLKTHMTTHTNEERPFHGKRFSRQHDCSQHEQSHSNYCPSCNQMFTCTDALNQHLRSEDGTKCQRTLDITEDWEKLPVPKVEDNLTGMNAMVQHPHDNLVLAPLQAYR